MNAPSKVTSGTRVYAAIAAVQGELAKVGIAKNRKNKQGEGYMFRGIDDVYAALSPLLAQYGLCVIPRVIERISVERQSARGNPLFYVTVHAEFDFVSSEDGSMHTAATFGEAMDSGDKATNKAMSAAYKYAAFMTFAIPTEGDNDADGTTHDVAASPAQERHNGLIDDGQWAHLVQLIEAKQADSARFCKFMKVNSLKEIPSARFADAVQALKAKPDPKPAPNPQRDEILADEVPY